VSSSVCRSGEWSRTSPTSIAFHGEIEKDELSRFMAIYQPTDETLIVDSTGGHMASALDIGKILINNKNLTVIVRGVCMSSCANYLFLAGQTKVMDGGLVGFHGNWKAFYQSEKFKNEAAAVEPVLRAKLLAWHQQKVAEESEFFSRTGADQSLFDKTQKENDDGLYDAYLPGSGVFAEYGIRNVIGHQNVQAAEKYARFKFYYDNGSSEPKQPTASRVAR
jgi:ATP-dependent protease ClpP protease subunit